VNAVDLALDGSVCVDLHEARALANRLVLATDSPPPAADTTSAAVATLSQELLPDWYEDWTIVEAEDWRQLRVHALEALAHHLVRDGRFADAISAALAAVRAEPLRETAYASLIHVHLAEGNRCEALAAFERCRASLRAELGLDPSPALHELIRDIEQPRSLRGLDSWLHEPAGSHGCIADARRLVG
jgi:DNA-binding SARP family transcriptional activator